MKQLYFFIVSVILTHSSMGQLRIKRFTNIQNEISQKDKNGSRILVCECPEANRVDDENGVFMYCNPVDDKSFGKIYKRDFGFLMSNSDNASFLSQATFSIDKPSFSFRQIFLNDKRRVLSFGYDVKGTISDNISTLFNGKDGWSPGISLSPRVNIDLVKLVNRYSGFGGQLYNFEVGDRDKHLCRIRALDNELEARTERLKFKKRARKVSLDSAISIRPAYILSFGGSTNSIRSLDNLIGKFQMDIDSLDMLIADTLNYDQGKKYELNSKFKWSLRRFIWLSFGYNFTSKSYNVFDVNNSKDQFITSKDIWIKNPSITLNFYQTSEKPTKGFRYLNFYLGLTYSNELTNDILDDNYSQKYETDIVKYSQSLGNPPKTIQTTEKKSFYVGNDVMVTNHKLSMQSIFFFTKAKKIGLDLHCSYQKPDAKATLNVDYYSAGFGIIIPTVGTDGKSKLNISLLLDWNDLGGNIEKWKIARDANYDPNRLKDRISFALKVGLPIYKL